MSKSNSITMRELGAQSSLDSSASGGTGLGIGASGGGVDGSSMCSSISCSVSTQYLKSSQISQHNRLGACTIFLFILRQKLSIVFFICVIFSFALISLKMIELRLCSLGF